VEEYLARIERLDPTLNVDLALLAAAQSAAPARAMVLLCGEFRRRLPAL